ncbi:protein MICRORCHIDIA 1-like isoform X1 [Amaranthus tricolor]|uniref:protein MICRORCHIDIA 1-like isoform X1 n=1 Tax=Amaranthus tricolor TaxID=29722 RepID=UPI00258EF190|nr:protein MICRORCHIDIA 1-like isoform X1 [Amaranthus tricolor]XP_057541593.1 protein MICRORCHIDIA 1-like isoform X1 [Amaranthus tricolor]
MSNYLVDVVEIPSDDEEIVANDSIRQNNSLLQLEASEPPKPDVSVVPELKKQKLECRSFWKAGSYEIGPSSFVPAHGELEHARVHPKFLHSNATSHKWAFGAIAELLDNAVDEIHNGATFVKVDKILNVKDNSPALLFQDDGGGMDPEGIRKCMSLGYSSKTSNNTIGQYGNGFKTSTMRLGADVIVLSRSTRPGKATQSVGLLSYSFLRLTGQDDVIVPMVDFDISKHWAEPIIYSSLDDWTSNMNTILEWSPFATKEELMMQFEDVGSHGTKIIIYNLWLNDEGIYELNFDDDNEDIKLKDETIQASGSKVHKRTLELQSHISYRLRYSLRAYSSILYLKKFKNFKILLRGKPVEQLHIADELNYKEVVTYKPQLAATSAEVTVKTTIGFIKQAPDLNVSGFNVYHKNRLIRPFWKVVRDGSSVGNGVVGVLEANFIEPAHDKQDFERSSLYIKLESRLKSMVNDYWKSHCHFVGFQRRDQPPPPKIRKFSRNDDHAIRSSTSGAQEGLLNQPVAELAARPRRNYQEDASAVQSIIDLSADEAVDDSTDSLSIEQICEENIQLFARCEAHVQKEHELKHMVSKLEKELVETRNKCAQLALHLEKKKQQSQLQQSGHI